MQEGYKKHSYTSELMAYFERHQGLLSSLSGYGSSDGVKDGV